MRSTRSGEADVDMPSGSASNSAPAAAASSSAPAVQVPNQGDEVPDHGVKRARSSKKLKT